MNLKSLGMVALLWFCDPVVALPQTANLLRLDTGKNIYDTACVACHGADGRGTPQAIAGFEPPETFPDFTDCSATSREADADWDAIIHEGGPVRGFSAIMPSFREALTDEQIGRVIQHLRTFCVEPNWPPGEMNLPRPIATEKAFPEDEWVMSTSINAGDNPGFESVFIYEKRFGARNQVEIAAPIAFLRASPGRWYGGVGDTSLGFKRVLASSKQTGSLLSVVGEAVLPSGHRAHGLGSGATVFEAFAAYAQLLPRESFVQFQAGGEVPVHGRDTARALFWRTAAGASLAEDKGLGRMWSPMIELLADREFATGEKVNWDILPQFQVTLNKRQHLRANFGVRIPVNNTAGRSPSVVFYLLWDFFDGGLRDGW